LLMLKTKSLRKSERSRISKSAFMVYKPVPPLIEGPVYRRTRCWKRPQTRHSRESGSLDAVPAEAGNYFKRNWILAGVYPVLDTEE
jgi:hypothetical protein